MRMTWEVYWEPRDSLEHQVGEGPALGGRVLLVELVWPSTAGTGVPSVNLVSSPENNL